MTVSTFAFGLWMLWRDLYLTKSSLTHNNNDDGKNSASTCRWIDGGNCKSKPIRLINAEFFVTKKWNANQFFVFTFHSTEKFRRTISKHGLYFSFNETCFLLMRFSLLTVGIEAWLNYVLCQLDDTKRHIEKIISMLNVTSMESMDLNRKVIHENNEKFYETNNNRGMTQTEYYINQTHWKTLTLVCFRKSGSQLV